MPRPRACRWIQKHPAVRAWKPAGIPSVALREVAMTLDEYEALRLADREGLYQEEGARRLGVSRPTFGRILESAHRKVAEALVDGCLLLIEGGTVHSVAASPGAASRRGEPVPCPRCSPVVRRAPGRGPGPPEQQPRSKAGS